MSHYHHLSIEERESILAGIHSGKSIRQISRELGRAASSISREIRRHYKRKWQYSAVNAHKKYERNRERCHKARLLENDELRCKVQTLFLEHQWSPEQIANRLKHENNPLQISYATIYRGIYAGMLDAPDKRSRQRGVLLKLRHKGNRKRRKKKTDHRARFTFTPSIDQRPEEAALRSEPGHWEADTVNGMLHTGSVLTLVDRRSRYLLAAKLDTNSVIEVADKMIDLLSTLKDYDRKSVTCDRGQEFRQFNYVAEKVGINFYFSHPHSPWERPTNENTNGLLREYMPKRTSFLLFSNDDVLRFSSALNFRPRKCLGWATPAEVFFDLVLHLT